MVRVGAAPDAIVADQAKSDGPINGPINGPIKKRVLQFVREHAGCKRADIANGIGVSLRSLKRALEGLSAEIQYRSRWKSRPGEDSCSSGDRGQGRFFCGLRNRWCKFHPYCPLPDPWVRFFNCHVIAMGE